MEAQCHLIPNLLDNVARKRNPMFPNSRVPTLPNSVDGASIDSTHSALLQFIELPFTKIHSINVFEAEAHPRSQTIKTLSTKRAIKEKVSYCFRRWCTQREHVIISDTYREEFILCFKFPQGHKLETESMSWDRHAIPHHKSPMDSKCRIGNLRVHMLDRIRILEDIIP